MKNINEYLLSKNSTKVALTSDHYEERIKNSTFESIQEILKELEYEEIYVDPAKYEIPDYLDKKTNGKNKVFYKYEYEFSADVGHLYILNKNFDRCIFIIYDKSNNIKDFCFSPRSQFDNLNLEKIIKIILK